MLDKPFLPRLEDQFLKAVAELQKGGIPARSQFKSLDERDAYEKRAASLMIETISTVGLAVIRAAEALETMAKTQEENFQFTKEMLKKERRI